MALNKFKLGDKLLPCLHILLATVCSSHWEDTLTSEWKLSHEQAVFLTRTLLVDVNSILNQSVPNVKVYLTNSSKAPILTNSNSKGRQLLAMF